MWWPWWHLEKFTDEHLSRQWLANTYSIFWLFSSAYTEHETLSEKICNNNKLCDQKLPQNLQRGLLYSIFVDVELKVEWRFCPRLVDGLLDDVVAYDYKWYSLLSRLLHTIYINNAFFKSLSDHKALSTRKINNIN